MTAVRSEVFVHGFCIHSNKKVPHLSSGSISENRQNTRKDFFSNSFVRSAGAIWQVGRLYLLPKVAVFMRLLRNLNKMSAQYRMRQTVKTQQIRGRKHPEYEKSNKTSVHPTMVGSD